MEFNDLIKKRYSVRAYKPDPIEDEKLNFVLEAARLAPSAANRQPFHLIIIHTEGRQAELQRIYHRDWFTQAPLLVCACGIPRQGWLRYDNRLFMDVDVAIMMDHLILAATDVGLGTCWVASFNIQAARELLALPDEVEPLIFTPLGYPADQAGVKTRKSLTDLIRYERW